MTALAKAESWSIAPANMGELMQFSKLIADSELVPKDYRGKPGNVVIAIQMGADIGLTPMQAIQSIAVINGRATLWGDTMLAVVLASPLCKDVIEMSEADIAKQGFAKCIAQRVGRTDKASTFSIDDAKKAGLWGKQGPWQNYAPRMLKMRARAFALRDQFSDVLRGLASAEEQADVIEAKSTVVQMRSDTPVTDAMQLASDIANHPEGSWEEKHERVWGLYANSSVVDQPLTSIPTEKLVAYIQRLEATVKGPASSKTPESAANAKRASVDAVPYLNAARVELVERRKLEAEAAGADVETGELPLDQQEAPPAGEDEFRGAAPSVEGQSAA